MTLADLQSQLIDAMKRGDTVVVETIRFLISDVKNLAIHKYGTQTNKLTESDILEVVKKQVKTHRESVEAFEKAGRTELAVREKAQLGVLEAYLPKQISDEELKKLLEPVALAGGDFGPMMGKAMAAVKGLADGARVSAMLKSLV
jgi:uncharacterized protein